MPRSGFVLVTGMSGAGRSLALKFLEDLGFEAVDNLPLSMIGMLARTRQGTNGEAAPSDKPLAIGIDTRTRGFSVEDLITELGRLEREGAAAGVEGGLDWRPRLLFLDCNDDVLVGRYKETRRRHPLASDRPASDGIRLERELLAPLRDVADLTIDTSFLQPADFRQLISGHFGGAAKAGLTLTLLSFSFRHGVPREADLVFDARFLKNPHYDPMLRPLDGRDPAVGAYVASDPDYPSFFANLTTLLEPLLPRYLAEGKSYLTIAVGCTGGRHRSVYIAEELAKWAGELGFAAGVVHRDVHRPTADKA